MTRTGFNHGSYFGTYTRCCKAIHKKPSLKHNTIGRGHYVTCFACLLDLEDRVHLLTALVVVPHEDVR